MKTAVLLVLLSFSTRAQEAMSWDRPIRVLNDRNEVRWQSDGGTCLTPDAWSKVDDEYKRLQGVEYLHKTEPSPFGWLLAGAVVGSIVTAGLLVGVYVATK